MAEGRRREDDGARPHPRAGDAHRINVNDSGSVDLSWGSDQDHDDDTKGSRMSLGEGLARRVKTVSREVRVAMAAECASRVAPVYVEYPVGFSYPEVQRAVEIAWQFAAGRRYDDAEIQDCLAKVTKLVDYYCDDGLDLLAETTTVVLRALECVLGNDKESLRAAGRAMVSARAAAQAAEAMANDGQQSTSPKEAAIGEEQRWQDKAIAIARTWQGPVSPTMFDAAGAKPPEWFVDWLKRSDR